MGMGGWQGSGGHNSMGSGEDFENLFNGSINSSVSKKLKFGSNVKSTDKLSRQMESRGWTEESVKETVDNPFTIRESINRATGNPATVYFNKDGSYVIVDNITYEIVQISNTFDSNWTPDSDIVDPYIHTIKGG